MYYLNRHGVGYDHSLQACSEILGEADLCVFTLSIPPRRAGVVRLHAAVAQARGSRHACRPRRRRVRPQSHTVEPRILSPSPPSSLSLFSTGIFAANLTRSATRWQRPRNSPVFVPMRGTPLRRRLGPQQVAHVCSKHPKAFRVDQLANVRHSLFLLHRTPRICACSSPLGSKPRGRLGHTDNITAIHAEHCGRPPARVEKFGFGGQSVSLVRYPALTSASPGWG